MVSEIAGWPEQLPAPLTEIKRSPNATKICVSIRDSDRVYCRSQSQAARASDCLITGPRYQLRSDRIEWQMKTRIGQSCIRGIPF